MAALVSLDDPAALDAGRVGAKAAWLAEARQRGYPVLPGAVVPAECSAASISRAEAIVRRSGLGAARVAAASLPVDEDLRGSLEPARSFGSLLVVRSSTRLDDDGRWSGAFASLADVEPDELHVAVRSCWASLYSPDATARFEASGERRARVGMAVLIQPQVQPDAGGWTRVNGDAIEVAAVAGHPGPLFQGWVVGHRMTLTRDDLRTGDALPISPDALEALAALAWNAHDYLGATRLEWAIVAGRPIILQVSVTAAGPSRTSNTERDVSARADSIVAAGNGSAALVRGLGVSAGRAVGPSRALRIAGSQSSLTGREILLIDQPTPEIAPLLWHVAGLVSRSGNPGAHLFEVARSLHVPAAVVTAPIRWSDDDVIALDGSSGDVVAWDAKQLA